MQLFFFFRIILKAISKVLKYEIISDLQESFRVVMVVHPNSPTSNIFINHRAVTKTRKATSTKCYNPILPSVITAHSDVIFLSEISEGSHSQLPHVWVVFSDLVQVFCLTGAFVSLIVLMSDSINYKMSFTQVGCLWGLLD